MTIIRKPLWHIPVAWRDTLCREIVTRAERDEVDPALQRIYMIDGEAGTEIEFWFCRLGDLEAEHQVSALIRDAAASIEVDQTGAIGEQALPG